jgi:hypothetical protein
MRASLLFPCLLTIAGCPAPSDPPVDDVGTSDVGAHDAGGPIDAPIVPTDGGSSDGGGADAPVACAPTPGPATGGASCDLFELALYTFDDAAPRAELRGRLTPEGLTEGGCFVIDSVEVQVAGATVATLEGAPGLLGAGPAFAELTARCEDDVDRFGRFGFLVHGRLDGGTFTGECADAEGGSRWPPAVRVTCHHNVDRSPFDANAMVSQSSFGDSSNVHVTMLHGPGGAITSADDTIHVIPGFASGFGPTLMLEPFDSSGWTASVSESTSPAGTTSQIQLFSDTALPPEICPPPSLEPPGPEDPLPGVFLVGITGSSEHGPYRTEAYVNYCVTIGTR